MSDRDIFQLAGIVIAYCFVMPVLVIVSVAIEDMSWGSAIAQLILVPALVAYLLGGILYLVLKRIDPREEDGDE